jgi:predicted acetyltransferase
VKYRLASTDDCPLLADWNDQLIQDEGHRNPMTVTELEQRMRAWLTTGEYQALLFEERGECVAYVLYSETETEIYLRQFFVVRDRRRAGIGRRIVEQLFTKLWPQHKRWSVDVLTKNESALSFWRSMGYQEYSLILEIMPKNKLTRRPADQETITQ